MIDETPEDAVARPQLLRRFARAVASATHRVGNLIAPPVCLACHDPIAAHDALCSGCWNDVNFIRPPVCDRLGLPLPFGGEGPLVSAAAIADPPLYGRARAALVFDGVARRLIHGFKYSDRHEPRRLLARCMVNAGAELISGADLLVPVPLARWRLVRRQFNQAALLAGEIGSLTGVPTDPLALWRTRSTSPQVGASRAARARNVAGAFAVPEGKRSALAGKRLLLIDDVITTGATVEACTRALLTAGAASVDVLAVAMVTEPRVVSP